MIESFEDTHSETASCEACELNCCTKSLPIFLRMEEVELFSDVLPEGGSLEVNDDHAVVTMPVCPHLSRAGQCSIYERRPLDCRMHPMMRDGEGWRIDVSCLHAMSMSVKALRTRAESIWAILGAEGLHPAYQRYASASYPRVAGEPGGLHVDFKEFVDLRRAAGVAGLTKEYARRGALRDQESGLRAGLRALTSRPRG